MRRGAPPPGLAAGPDSWPAAGPAEDPWDILPVSAHPEPGQYGAPAEAGQLAQRAGHRGRLRLVRSPLAWTVLLAGLAVVTGGAIGLSRLAGHPGEVARPLVKTAPSPRGIFAAPPDRKSTRLNSSHLVISYAVFCLKKKKKTIYTNRQKTKKKYTKKKT